MADALVLGASTFCVWVQVPSSAPIKSTPAGVLFIGAEDGGERMDFYKGRGTALIKREGGTAKVPPSHIPFLAVVAGGGCVGLLGGRWRGAHTFPQRGSLCPDGTRKTTLTVFFHTIFPSGGEGFFVGAGRLFYWCGRWRGAHGFLQRAGCFWGWERLAGPERNGFLFTKSTIFICKMSEDFTCGIY